MIGCLRTLGLAARYVSGYLETDPRRGSRSWWVPMRRTRGWSLFVPGAGWLELDPTNDLVNPTRHITVAWGRDYSDVAPMRGVVFGPREHAGAVGVGRRPPSGVDRLTATTAHAAAAATCRSRLST